MKWKKVTNLISEGTKEAEKELTMDMLEPVSVKDVEEIIELMNVAHKIDASFKASLILSIDTFTIDSDSFESIKLQKGKKSNKIIVAHTTSIMSTETTIDIENIYGIVMDISFATKKERYDVWFSG